MTPAVTPVVGQVVQVVAGDRRVLREQQGDAAGRGVVGADVVDDVVRHRGAGQDLVGADRVAADRRGVGVQFCLIPAASDESVGSGSYVQPSRIAVEAMSVNSLPWMSVLTAPYITLRPGAAELGEPVSGEGDSSWR
jgi:hypothetical protein